MGTVRVAAAQLGPADDNKRANAARAEALVRQAADLGVDGLCFPELALTPYFCHMDPDDVDGYYDHDVRCATTAGLLAVAERAGITLVLPFAQRCDEGRFISAPLIDSDGTVRSHYQKMHLGQGEERFFDEGTNGFPACESSIGRVGVLVCADRSFPEAWRILAIARAEFVFAPYGTAHRPTHKAIRPNGTIDDLRDAQALRMRANAAMNSFYVVAAGKAGVEHGRRYIGDSMIISPWGEIIARASGDDDQLVIADVDRDAVAEIRARNQQLQRRRPEAYAALTRVTESS